MSASAEWDLLEAVASALVAISTTGRVPDLVRIVDAPQIKHVPEAKPSGTARIFLVSPGDVIITEDTSCKMLFEGDLLVTGIAQHNHPEDLKAGDYVPTAKEKLLILEDIKGAVNGKQLSGNAITFVANRNMNVEIDGWAVVQVQVSFRYTEAT
jgi:hypothetical protein